MNQPPSANPNDSLAPDGLSAVACAKEATNRTRAAAAVGLAALAFTLAQGSDALAESLRCAGTNVTVHGAHRAEVQGACGGVVEAVAFLASLGLETGSAAEVLLVEALPAIQGGPAAYGCKSKSDNRIYVLTFAECRKLPLGPDLQVDDATHRGLVAHEVGHHIATANFRTPKPTVVAHEYIAYVTMLATMEAQARERILRQFPGEGFESVREITLTIYLIDPTRFGAHAYRHFMRPGNGASFVQRVLSGRALATEDPP
ncbi:MAG: DUF6639 family protein [Burkholderiaceae bacterium]